MHSHRVALARKTDPCSAASLLYPDAPSAPRGTTRSEESGTMPRTAFAVRASRPARIMLVDDDPEFIEIASALLQNSRWTVATFTSPLRALAQLPQTTPDLALIDVLMPEMDGFECADRIRRRSPETAIIFVTGVPEVIENHPHYGSIACGVLYKPFHPDQLRQCVEDAWQHFCIPSSPRGTAPSNRREAFICAKNLSQREVLALEALAASKAYKQIQDEQGWSESLTHKIIHRAFVKLNVRTRYDAATLWNENTR